MPDASDMDLVREFARTNSEAAFADIQSKNGEQIAETSVSFSRLLAIAYDKMNGGHAHTWQMVLPTNLPTGDFDYFANVSDHVAEHLQAEIKSQFGLIGREEIIETNVLCLKVKNPDVLEAFKSQPFSQPPISRYSLSTYLFNAVNPDSFILDLELIFHQPILDETGSAKAKTRLPSGFFVALPRKTNDLDLARKALLDQLGLELVSTNMPIEMLVVERVK